MALTRHTDVRNPPRPHTAPQETSLVAGGRARPEEDPDDREPVVKSEGQLAWLTALSLQTGCH